MAAPQKNFRHWNKNSAAFCGIVGVATDNTVLESFFTAAIERFGQPADIVVANAGLG